MTTISSNQKDQNFDNEELIEEELELSPVKQVLALVALASWHMRRIVVFAPMFGLVFLVVGFMWLQSVREEASLNAAKEQLNILLDQPGPEPEALLQRADGWDTAYQVVLDSRVVRPPDSDLVERVINAASDAGLLIIETGTTVDVEATIENESFNSTPVLISAVGTLDGIEEYLNALETEEFAAFGIDAVTVEEGQVGYQLTLRGLYYSLPENFGEIASDEDEIVIAVTPVLPVDGGNAK